MSEKGGGGGRSCVNIARCCCFLSIPESPSLPYDEDHLCGPVGGGPISRVGGPVCATVEPRPTYFLSGESFAKSKVWKNPDVKWKLDCTHRKAIFAGVISRDQEGREERGI